MFGLGRGAGSVGARGAWGAAAVGGFRGASRRGRGSPVRGGPASVGLGWERCDGQPKGLCLEALRQAALDDVGHARPAAHGPDGGAAGGDGPRRVAGPERGAARGRLRRAWATDADLESRTRARRPPPRHEEEAGGGGERGGRGGPEGQTARPRATVAGGRVAVAGGGRDARG